MGRLDALDLGLKLNREEEARRLTIAQGRLLQLRLAFGGLIGPGEIGPPVLVLSDAYIAQRRQIRDLPLHPSPREFRKRWAESDGPARLVAECDDTLRVLVDDLPHVRQRRRLLRAGHHDPGRRTGSTRYPRAPASLRSRRRLLVPAPQVRRQVGRGSACVLS